MESKLIRACENGDLNEAKSLVEQGADIQAYDGYNWPLTWACIKGHFEVVQYLVEKGANIHAQNDESLRLSALCGHLEIVKYLVEKGANIHAGDDVSILTNSCLYKCSNPLVVKYLVEKGANIHANNDDALNRCFAYGHVSGFVYLSSFYTKEELFSITKISKHYGSYGDNFTCFYDLMYFFFYQKHSQEFLQDQSDLWEGNIGLIVASFTWA